MPELPKARIVRRRDLTNELWLAWFKPEVSFTFKPGQYCTIGVNGVERAYSIVSAPYEPELELFIELVPQGELTPVLHRLGVGEEVTIRPRAKGVFTLDEKYKSHMMVATVTGVVPYVSILRNYLHSGGQGYRFYVLEGASYQDEFGYDEELKAMARAHPDTISYMPTVSRPSEERNKGWKGASGRANTLVEDYLARFGLKKETTLVYACGHPGMIEDVKAKLLPKGWNVKEERFWVAK